MSPRTALVISHRQGVPEAPSEESEIQGTGSSCICDIETGNNMYY